MMEGFKNIIATLSSSLEHFTDKLPFFANMSSSVKNIWNGQMPVMHAEPWKQEILLGMYQLGQGMDVYNLD